MSSRWRLALQVLALLLSLLAVGFVVLLPSQILDLTPIYQRF